MQLPPVIRLAAQGWKVPCVCVYIGVFGIHIPGMLADLGGDKCYDNWGRLTVFKKNIVE